MRPPLFWHLKAQVKGAVAGGAYEEPLYFICQFIVLEKGYRKNIFLAITSPSKDGIEELIFRLCKI